MVLVGFFFEYSSSVLSIVFVRLDENVKVVMVIYNELIVVEFVRSESLIEDCKKVFFVCEKSELRKVVKWRVIKIYDGELVVKCIEYILVCLVGLFWFI